MISPVFQKPSFSTTELYSKNVPDVVYTNEIHFTSDDIITMGSSPIVIIPAVDGMSIVIDEAIVYVSFGTVAYNFTAGLSAFYSGGIKLMQTLVPMGVINVASDYAIALIDDAPTQGYVFSLGTDVVLKPVNSADPSQGDGNMVVRVKYRLFPF